MFAEDLSVFFNTAEHATAATLDGLPVVGIYGNAYAQAYGISTRDSLFTMASADCANAVIGSSLVVGSIIYRVSGMQPDGTGVTTLVLERTS